MKAVLLAAGEGIRLLPLTATRPKHLLKLGGKPILEHCIEALKANGITEAIVITHYMGDSIRAYFGDGTKFGFKLEYIDQKTMLGTGNAAKCAQPYIDGDFLLVYGDLLFSSDAVRKVLETYNAGMAAAAMAVVPVENPESYGVIELDENGHIKRIVEKPKRDHAPSNLANAGVYVFRNNIFATLKKLEKTQRGEEELTDAITMLAGDGETVLAAEISKDDWFDIGRPWDLLEANIWVLKRMPHRVLGDIEEGAHLTGPVHVSETARVRSGAYIEGPVFIDDGADVGPNCFIRPYTSIGRHARVGNACEVKNSVIMDGTHVGHLSYVGDSILGEKCNLGAGTITANLRFDGGHVKMMIRDTVLDTNRRKLGVVLGDNVRTGIGALLMPGVKVGNDSWVGPGLMLERDLKANTMAFLKQNWDKRDK